MPFYGRLIHQKKWQTKWRLSFLVSCFALWSAFSGTPGISFAAIEADRPLHYSADEQIWNRRENKVDLKGHALVRQTGESIMADSIELDLKERTIHAKGNCVYLSSETVIQGEEMNFNLDTRTGSIIKGRVSNEQFSLAGERINKLSNQRFQTHWGEYSTCRDCPQSWAFQAEDVDMQIEGYAYMSNVTTKIKDAPSLWIPYMIVPLKAKRQSGVLFPTIRLSGENGFVFVLPYFWAISRSADMTFGFGRYSAKGWRGEWEGRYVLSDRSQGTANFYYLQDNSTSFKDIISNRWALSVTQSQELPWNITEKLKFYEVSDNLYPIYIGDVPGSGEVFLGSSLSFSYSSPAVSSYVLARRYRNLINTDPNPNERITGFDGRTVQVLPAAVVTTNDQLFLDNTFSLGLTMGATNFTRSGRGYDHDGSRVPFGADPGPNPPAFLPGVDPIRKATRFSLSPSLYSTFRPLDVLSVTPSLKYNAYFYNFKDVPGVDPLYRGYLLYQTDVSTQWEKVYEMENPDIPRVKHLIRPSITYSYIPLVNPDVKDDEHPFMKQMRYKEGYNFDNYDIVPLDSSTGNIRYFTPLGNSLAYGFTTQVIRRRGRVELAEAGDASYQRIVEWTANHTYNFRDTEKPLSRFNSALRFEFDVFSSTLEYAYTPYIPGPHWLSSSVTYTWEKGFHQRILAFDRSISAGYTYAEKADGDGIGTSNLTSTLNYSLSDFILPSASSSYDFVSHRFLSYGLNVNFQSPSRCWKIGLGFARNITTGTDTSYDFVLNLTGSGFSGMTEITAPGKR